MPRDPEDHSVIVHWFVVTKDGPWATYDRIGRRTGGKVIRRSAVACNPSLKPFPRFQVGSADTHAVNCVECAKHPEFAEAFGKVPKTKAKYEAIPPAVRAELERQWKKQLAQ